MVVIRLYFHVIANKTTPLPIQSMIGAATPSGPAQFGVAARRINRGEQMQMRAIKHSNRPWLTMRDRGTHTHTRWGVLLFRGWGCKRALQIDARSKAFALSGARRKQKRLGPRLINNLSDAAAVTTGLCARVC